MHHNNFFRNIYGWIYCWNINTIYSNVFNIILFKKGEQIMEKIVTIATKEELEILFDTKEKRKIFKNIISRIINEMMNRTVHVPFVKLHEVIE